MSLVAILWPTVAVTPQTLAAFYQLLSKRSHDIV